MSKYYNSTTGELTSEAPWGNHYYDDDLKATLFSDWSEVADDYAITEKYCYYDYGLSYKMVKGKYTISDGEYLFDSLPTDAELESAFPSTAGSIVHTITENTASGDLITIEGNELTAGTSFSVGSDVSTTATNIATALSSITSFAGLYIANASNGTITITEKLAGGGNTPTSATTSGTVIISSGTATSSVKGYSTASKLNLLDELETKYISYDDSIKRSLANIDLNISLTETEISSQVTSLRTQKEALDSWYTKEQEEIING